MSVLGSGGECAGYTLRTIDPNLLDATGNSPQQCYTVLRYTKELREKAHQLLICLSTGCRCSDSELQMVALWTGDFVLASLGLNTKVKDQVVALPMTPESIPGVHG